MYFITGRYDMQLGFNHQIINYMQTYDVVFYSLNLMLI